MSNSQNRQPHIETFNFPEPLMSTYEFPSVKRIVETILFYKGAKHDKQGAIYDSNNNLFAANLEEVIDIAKENSWFRYEPEESPVIEWDNIPKELVSGGKLYEQK